MSENIKQLINADLAEERAKTTLNSEEFAIWWAGGKDALEKKRAAENLFFNDPELKDELHTSHLSHADYVQHQLKKVLKFLPKYYKWFEKENANRQVDLVLLHDFMKNIGANLNQGLFSEKNPARLHHGMFLPAILSNASEEQKAKWIPKAWKMDGWIGTYAQTELGHGTFIRGLETRADFDIRRQEFILNTPKLSAYKFWPGGLGNAANVAIVMANLYINGRPWGLQSFLVPLRDEKTHQPLAGVDIGEIGPKIGENGANNGFLGLKNVRIPRTNMLMKHAQVLSTGKFIKSPDPTLLYGTMMYVRVGIVNDVAELLLIGSTIATRYSIIRRQGVMGNEREQRIFDYVTQQAKIIPFIAKGLVFNLTSQRLWQVYIEYIEKLAAGERTDMPQMHALSCVLKAVCSQDAEEGIEILRKSCGGHGFLSSANFGKLYGAATAACTYEGENTVLFLQTARFLMKMIKQRDNGQKLPTTVAYLEHVKQSSTKLNNQQSKVVLMRALCEILEQTATVLVEHAFEQQELNKLQYGEHLAANQTSLLLVKAAIMHGHCYLARTALVEAEKLQSSQSMSATLTEVISQLLELYVIDTFLAELGNVLRFNGQVNGTQVAYLEERYQYLLSCLRSNIIAVVDGFDFHDRILNSTLGSWDGRVYERLMAEARANLLNKPAVTAAIKPFMSSKL